MLNIYLNTTTRTPSVVSPFVKLSIFNSYNKIIIDTLISFSIEPDLGKVLLNSFMKEVPII